MPRLPKSDPRHRMEIQVHPSDIRKKVRDLFLDRRQQWLLKGALAALVVFLVAGAVLTPRVVRSRLAATEYEGLLSERRELGSSLEGQVEELATLEAQGDRLRLRLDKILLTYGLGTPESIGQGGYPVRPGDEIDSIYGSLVSRGNRTAARVAEQNQVLAAFLGEIQDFESAHASRSRTTPSVSPVQRASFVLTSPFGNRRSPFTKQLDFHAGIDMAAPVGTPVHAPADGFVTFAGRYPLKRSVSWWRYGNLVVVRSGERFVTLYGHLSSVAVKTGQRVRQGDLLGKVGNTGWSTSPHLHYEVRVREVDGRFRPVDPRIYILDHRWRDEERLLIRARSAPDGRDFEPLPPILAE
jgi:murein DD-endopeptidase MepM/ murein hydrolase activator NlpD